MMAEQPKPLDNLNGKEPAKLIGTDDEQIADGSEKQASKVLMNGLGPSLLDISVNESFVKLQDPENANTLNRWREV